MKTNSLKAWLLAARPKTLSGAAVPVMIGLALAYTDAKQYDGEVFSWCAALLCLFFSFAMQQVKVNTANNYAKHKFQTFTHIKLSILISIIQRCRIFIDNY